jgi:outer membrane protein assembly factor BamB
MQVIRRTIAVAVTSLAVCALIGAAPDSSATMFRGGPRHLGYYDSSPPNLTTVLWRFRAKARILSSPAISDGSVFFGSDDGRIYRIRATDGVQMWSYQTGGPVRSSPAVANGLVIVGSSDGFVYALNETTGTLRWRFKTQGERRFTAPGIHGIQPSTEMMPDPYDLLTSSPVVENGTVYIGSGDHHIYAIDAAAGTLRWKFETGDVVHASPAIARGTVYVGSWDRYLYAIDARSGNLRWRFLTGDDRAIYNQIGVVGSAAVEKGRVYFGCRDSHFYALDAADGKLLWKHDQHGSWVIASPALANGLVFYTTSDQRKFFALDSLTGQERFTVSQGAFSFSSPSVAQDTVYFGAFDGRLYAVDTLSGKIVGTFSTDASQKSLPPHLDSAGALRIADFNEDDTLDGTMVALRRIMSLGSIVGSPVIANGVLFVGSTDGTMYAIT